MVPGFGMFLCSCLQAYKTFHIGTTIYFNFDELCF